MREELEKTNMPSQLADFFVAYGPTPKAKTLDQLVSLMEDCPLDRTQAIKTLRRCFERVFSNEQNIFLDDDDQMDDGPETLIVVLDKHLHIFPWEVTGTFINTRLYRQPSYWHLLRSTRVREQLNCVSYVLNPGGDLKHTEQFFLEKLNSEWKGIVGRAPGETEFLASLQHSDLFLYFGHGGGDAYVSGAKVRQLQEIAPSFLIGCSSGKMKTLGEFCPEGSFLNYLYAGCPTILVNLWDVTDKDIDKFTDDLFQRMGLWDQEDAQEADLARAINCSRASCFLKYANGAAPIVYGLPFSIQD